ncbi:MAP kinase phosphatase 6 [Chlorella sorokiniana]|uniref:MAP kinase phosphatase 6 n=1 Tax=Chlorella sorokiniana TaxID=3076 RepID=A0A2P6TIH1_CHLSO|nr:MAP kinase phosphatase 6 [Chlorella sorokiniana]|eukprot:PRW34077.1 MAP kinase phosphatase 6 [Chlorella sorokiniana]
MVAAANPVSAAAAPAGEAAGPPYGLPPLPAIPCPDYRGPTPWSNWVIKGRLLAGAYPASLDDNETDRILSTLLTLGVNTFVCLQAEFSLHTPESAWRAGQGLRPYIKDAQRILIRARETGSQRIKQARRTDKLDFLHLPVLDGNVTSDAAMSRLADDCCARILRGERMYIHCWGGHGRTGTLIATMLGRLYGITCASALRFTQAFHDSRKFPQGVRSPQTTVQVAQVKRLLPDPPSMRGVVYSKDPSVVLDDVILRPPSAPSSPPKAAPLGVVCAAAGSGGADAGGRADMEVDGDEAPVLPTVPMNQQRKEAIRAKSAGGSAGGSAPATVVAGGQAAALQAASLQPLTAVKEAQGSGAAAAPSIRAAPAAGGQQRLDWLSSVFGKDADKKAAGGGGSAGQDLLGASLAASAGKAAAGGSGTTINLTATAVGAQWASGGVERVDMRPNNVAVGLPEAPDRSTGSVARLINYLSGRSGSVLTPQR